MYQIESGNRLFPLPFPREGQPYNEQQSGLLNDAAPASKCAARQAKDLRVMPREHGSFSPHLEVLQEQYSYDS